MSKGGAATLTPSRGPDLITALQQQFGFAAFRPGQEAAIEHLLAGRHSLVVMPTGAGKSLVYQLAACLLPGTTLVVSPLIALMKDQVDALSRRGIPATAINSTVPPGEQARRLEGMRQGRYRLVYVAPERLRHRPFSQALAQNRVSLLAVDEAHCISQWGHDFRPDYLHIAAARQEMDHPVTAALTATATPQVQGDILLHLDLSDAERIVTGFNRPNLSFQVRYTPDLPDKLRTLREFLAGKPGTGIVYVSTRREAEEVADFVSEVVGREARAYHAGLEDARRTAIQDAFMSGRLNLVVATNAFGMGVDRADVRFVLHFSLPGTLEAYYQEAGRAGRDGEPARCVLLYAPRDRALQEWFIANDAPSPKELEALHHAVRDQAREGLAVLTLDDLALTTGLPEVKLRVGLSLLERMETLRRLGDEGRRLWLEVGAWRPERLRVTTAEVEDRRAHKRRQLARMVAYAETDACRRRLTLDHFGDPGPADAPACCDNCLTAISARPVVPAADREAIESLPAEATVPLAVVDAVRSLPWAVGRKKLAQVLKGSRTKEILTWGYDRSPYYGRLADLTIREIEGLIEQLVAGGYVKVVGGDRPVVCLTPQGERAFAQREAIQLQPPLRMRPDTSRISVDEKLLFQELRIWRSKAAHSEHVPAFRIFHDSALREIAHRRPSTLEELLSIKGVGPRKVEAYGGAVLPIVGNYQQTTGKEEEQVEDAITAFLSRSHPRRLHGPWQAGWALDFHSRFSGTNWGRTKVGDLGYRLKYRNEHGLTGILADRLHALVQDHPELARVDAILPAPPSTPRPTDPVSTLATALGQRLGVPVQSDWLVKTRATQPQKELRTLAQKRANVAGAFAVRGPVRGRRLLVLDDLYDSGATLEEVTRVLQRAGATAVLVLTLTRTIHSDA